MGGDFPERLEIVLVPSATAEVRDLVRELNVELSSLYAPEQRHGLSLEAIFQPLVRFFVVRCGVAALGCGGVALFSEFGEVKRMYVRPAARRQGVADALMDRLQREALHAGLKILRLETGVHSHAAIQFYKRHGFVLCAPFEPYASMPPANVATSLFMERRLD